MASEEKPVVFPSTASESAEERMLRADLVSEMVARKDRGSTAWRAPQCPSGEK